MQYVPSTELVSSSPEGMKSTFLPSARAAFAAFQSFVTAAFSGISACTFGYTQSMYLLQISLQFMVRVTFFGSAHSGMTTSAVPKSKSPHLKLPLADTVYSARVSPPAVRRTSAIGSVSGFAAYW